jgi:hypothetical protein
MLLPVIIVVGGFKGGRSISCLSLVVALLRFATLFCLRRDVARFEVEECSCSNQTMKMGWGKYCKKELIANGQSYDLFHSIDEEKPRMRLCLNSQPC